MTFVDTNVVSELLRPQPHPSVVAFFERAPAGELFLPSPCEAELRYGVARLPAGRRRTELAALLDGSVHEAFGPRVPVFDRACAAGYAAVRVARERAGRSMGVIDAMIGGMALAHGATLATRNVTDFEDCGLLLVNPWAT